MIRIMRMVRVITQEQYRKLPKTDMSDLEEIRALADEFDRIATGEDKTEDQVDDQIDIFKTMMKDRIAVSPVWNNAEMLSYLYWFYMDYINADIGETKDKVAWSIFLMVAEERIGELGGELREK